MTKDILDRPGHARPRLLTAGKRGSDWVCAVFVRLMVVNSGAVAAEYAFLIVFVSILAAVGMIVLGDDLRGYFQDLATAIDNASQPTPDPFAT